MRKATTGKASPQRGWEVGAIVSVALAGLALWLSIAPGPELEKESETDPAPSSSPPHGPQPSLFQTSFDFAYDFGLDQCSLLFSEGPGLRVQCKTGVKKAFEGTCDESVRPRSAVRSALNFGFSTVCAMQKAAVVVAIERKRPFSKEDFDAMKHTLIMQASLGLPLLPHNAIYNASSGTFDFPYIPSPDTIVTAVVDTGSICQNQASPVSSPPTSLAEDERRTQQVDQLMEWAVFYGSSQLRSCQPVVTPDGGVGMKAVKDIPKGSLLFHLHPKKQLGMSEVSALKSDLGNFFSQDDAKRWGGVIDLHLLCEQNMIGPSFWEPYLATLPSLESFYWSPLLYDDNDVKMLHGYKVALDRRSTLLHHAHVLHSIARSLANRLPCLDVSLGDALWATIITHSRAFAVTKDGQSGLVPMTDLFNHDHLRGQVATMSPNDVQLFTQDDFAEGEEVYISYGPMSQEESFTQYGFFVESLMSLDLTPVKPQIDGWTGSVDSFEKLQSALDSYGCLHSRPLSFRNETLDDDFVKCLYLVTISAVEWEKEESPTDVRVAKGVYWTAVEAIRRKASHDLVALASSEEVDAKLLGGDCLLSDKHRNIVSFRRAYRKLLTHVLNLATNEGDG